MTDAHCFSKNSENFKKELLSPSESSSSDRLSNLCRFAVAIGKLATTC